MNTKAVTVAFVLLLAHHAPAVVITNPTNVYQLSGSLSYPNGTTQYSVTIDTPEFFIPGGLASSQYNLYTFSSNHPLVPIVDDDSGIIHEEFRIFLVIKLDDQSTPEPIDVIMELDYQGDTLANLNPITGRYELNGFMSLTTYSSNPVSPGSAFLNSSFTLIPEPSTAIILCLGGALAARRKRPS